MKPSVWAFSAIGVPWQIETGTELSASARTAISAVIERFDIGWSRFRADSVVTGLAKTGGAAPAPPDAELLLDTYRQAGEATAGAINPLLGDSLSALGYDAELSLRPGEPVPAPPDWTAILTWSATEVRLSRPVMIDIGALGKGRLVDAVLTEVAQHADGDIVVDASGDIAVRGAPQRIGLEHPFDPSRAIGVATVTDAALCASATNRRNWAHGMHHVLDARTGTPVQSIAATWVIAADALHADALATALFFDGGPELAARWGADWVRMSTAGRVEWSPGCPIELFR